MFQANKLKKEQASVLPAPPGGSPLRSRERPLRTQEPRRRPGTPGNPPRHAQGTRLLGSRHARPELLIRSPNWLNRHGRPPPASARRTRRRSFGLPTLPTFPYCPLQRQSPSSRRPWGPRTHGSATGALVACSSFGKKAAEWSETITTMAKSDPENLVRMRAAEYLGISGSGDPVPLLTEVLRSSDSPAEWVLILNTMAVLHDSPKALPLQGPPGGDRRISGRPGPPRAEPPAVSQDGLIEPPVGFVGSRKHHEHQVVPDPHPVHARPAPVCGRSSECRAHRVR